MDMTVITTLRFVLIANLVQLTCLKAGDSENCPTRTVKISSYVRTNQDISSSELKTHVCNNIKLSLEDSSLKAIYQNCTVANISRRGEQIRATVSLQFNHSFSEKQSAGLRKILNNTSFTTPASLVVDNKTRLLFTDQNTCNRSVETAQQSHEMMPTAEDLHTVHGKGAVYADEKRLSPETDMNNPDSEIFRKVQNDICTDLNIKTVFIDSTPSAILNCSLDQFSGNFLTVKLALVPPPTFRRDLLKQPLDKHQDQTSTITQKNKLDGAAMTSGEIQNLNVQILLLFVSVTVVSSILGTLV